MSGDAHLDSAAAADRLLSALGEHLALAGNDYDPALTVRYASRLDQIHFKLHATVDRGGGKHFADLRVLEPRRSELVAAARWARTHDPSEGFLSVLRQVLAYFGVEDADLGT